MGIRHIYRSYTNQTQNRHTWARKKWIPRTNWSHRVIFSSCRFFGAEKSFKTVVVRMRTLQNSLQIKYIYETRLHFRVHRNRIQADKQTNQPYTSQTFSPSLCVCIIVFNEFNITNIWQKFQRCIVCVCFGCRWVLQRFELFDSGLFVLWSFTISTDIRQYILCTVHWEVTHNLRKYMCQSMLWCWYFTLVHFLSGYRAAAAPKAYLHTYLLESEFPNGINKSNIFQTEKNWMRRRMKENQSTIRNENEKKQQKQEEKIRYFFSTLKRIGKTNGLLPFFSLSFGIPGVERTSVNTIFGLV